MAGREENEKVEQKVGRKERRKKNKGKKRKWGKKRGGIKRGKGGRGIEKGSARRKKSG